MLSIFEEVFLLTFIRIKRGCFQWWRYERACKSEQA